MRRSLTGLLLAEAVSLTGTRVSMVALPWFVLTTTGSATRTGLVAFAEMAPYVVAKAASGPWIDRLGPRRVSVTTDATSALVVGLVPLLHALGMLPFGALLVVVAVAGTVRGPGDGAKAALVPLVVADAGVPLERATGLSSAVERLASTLGAAAAGLLVALVGASTAIAVDAASFLVAAALVAATAPRQGAARTVGGHGRPGYRQELAEGWHFLRRDRVLVAMVMMVAATNLLDAAYTAVLVPVWARDSGGGAAAIGLLFGTFSGAALLGSLVASAYADRLPRFATYVVAFALAGLPRFVVLALGAPLAAVLGVSVVVGFACGFLNPILGAVIYERIPEHLMGRVTALQSSLCWAGIPLGPVLGGLAVAALGLSPALLVTGGLYLVATMAPVVDPRWREIDRPREVLPAA